MNEIRGYERFRRVSIFVKQGGWIRNLIFFQQYFAIIRNQSNQNKQIVSNKKNCWQLEVYTEKEKEDSHLVHFI